MTMMMVKTMVRTTTGDIPRAGETQEAARSVRERVLAPEQTQALRLVRRRNSFLPQSARPRQKNPQA
jgi:hypothetical protein